MKAIEKCLLHGGSLTPCLIGPTGVGKTARAFKFSQDLHLPLTILLPGTALPEDILGLPIVDAPSSTTNWTIPTWAQEASVTPRLIFIDELDKASRDVHGALLTLLASHTVRGTALHPDTRILCAMQPVEIGSWLSHETGRALSARLIFFPLTYEWEFLESKWNVDLVGFPTGDLSPAPILPNPSARQVDWAFEFLNAQSLPDAQEEFLDERKILAGIFSPMIIDEIITRWTARQQSKLNPQGVIEAINENPKLLSTLSVPELVNLSTDIFHHGTPQTIKSSLIKVWTLGGPDFRRDFLKSLSEGLAERTRAAPHGELEIAAGASDDEVTTALREAVVEAGRIWRERKKDEEGNEQ